MRLGQSSILHAIACRSADFSSQDFRGECKACSQIYLRAQGRLPVIFAVPLAIIIAEHVLPGVFGGPPRAVAAWTSRLSALVLLAPRAVITHRSRYWHSSGRSTSRVGGLRSPSVESLAPDEREEHSASATKLRQSGGLRTKGCLCCGRFPGCKPHVETRLRTPLDA